MKSQIPESPLESGEHWRESGSSSLPQVDQICSIHRFWEGIGSQIGWIFGQIPNGLWPPPSISEYYITIFYDRNGCIYARRYDGQIVCTWFSKIGTILRGGGLTAVWNLSENSSDLVVWPVSLTVMTTRAFFTVCLFISHNCRWRGWRRQCKFFWPV